MMRAALGVAVGWTMLAALTAGARAQISLSSAVDLALHNDPTVKMAQSDVDKAQASRMEARDAYFPTLGVGGGVGEGLGVPLDVPQVFTVASHSLLFNFSQRDYMRAADAGLRAANLALLEAHDGVAEDVVLTYVRLNNAEQREAAMGQEFGDATRLVAIVQDRLNAGQDNRIDLLKARQTAAQVHLAQLQTQDDVANFTDHLTRLIGLPGTRLATVASSIPAMPSLDTPIRLEPDSYGIQSAFANASSKQEQAFGDARWRLRPQLSFGFNYSRISTAFTNYTVYYPGFNKPGNSDNAVSVGIQLQIPILDQQRSARARESADDAHHALLDAENRRNQFLEGRFKLRHSMAELEAQADLAGIDRDLAQEQLNTVMIQLSANSAGTETHQLSPEDEQHARIAVSTRTVDFLNDQLALTEARVSLMRQTSTLDAWLQAAVNAGPGTPAGVVAAPFAP
jgi:outer membrane protein TolC